MMRINQSSNTNQMNQSLLMENNKNIENKVKSIVSQLPGNIRNISYKYNSQSISKAKITVVVSSKEEAKRVRQNIDNEVDIKVIIREELKVEEDSVSDDTLKTTQESSINDDQKSKDYSQNIYSFNRGPDGKIYGIIKDEKETTTKEFINSSENRTINSNFREKYIHLYKRYNFKNILIKENQIPNQFSLKI
jgi:hypothetical protein